MLSNVKMNEIKYKLLRFPYVRKAGRYVKVKLGYVHTAYDTVKLSYHLDIEEDLSLDGAKKILLEWPSSVKKPYIGLVRESEQPTAYWPKYERFLKNNKIKYDFYDIHSSKFIDEAKKFDIILWRTPSSPHIQAEAASKMKILQSYLGKLCLPSQDELWFYEDKINQYYLAKINGLPFIKTFVTNNFNEAVEYINSCSYPIVSKVTIGSSSQGVMMVKNRRQAMRICRKVFESGKNTCWTYEKQKNYLLFQEFVQGSKYDLRVIVVGNSFFGYYREVPKNDFRASGNYGERFDEIPEEAMLLAKKVKDKFPKSRMLAVDMLRDERDNKLYVIETSIFPGIDFPSETIVNGKLGRYVYDGTSFQFREGKLWAQELAVAEIMKEWIDFEKLEHRYKISSPTYINIV